MYRIVLLTVLLVAWIRRFNKRFVYGLNDISSWTYISINHFVLSDWKDFKCGCAYNRPFDFFGSHLSWKCLVVFRRRPNKIHYRPSWIFRVLTLLNFDKICIAKENFLHPNYFNGDNQWPCLSSIRDEWTRRLVHGLSCLSLDHSEWAIIKYGTEKKLKSNDGSLSSGLS